MLGRATLRSCVRRVPQGSADMLRCIHHALHGRAASWSCAHRGMQLVRVVRTLHVLNVMACGRIRAAVLSGRVIEWYR